MAAHHQWSQRSRNRLETCDPRLRKLMNAVLRAFPHDITIIEGHRTNERQEELYAAGKSKLRAGQSKHNLIPSAAVDVAPLVDGKIDWEDRELWIGFAGFVRGAASQLGIPIRWGGDWDSDFDSAEHGFWDGPHFELEDDV